MRFIALVASLFIFCRYAHALDDTPSQFKTRQTEPLTGAQIRRDAVPASHVPLNKRYSELTEQEKRAVRAVYQPMAASDEPPYPATGLKRISSAMREAPEKWLRKGELQLLVRVDSKGEARSIEVMRSPSDRLTQFAANVLMAEKYKPALCRGIPCSMDFPYRLSYGERH